MTASVGEDPRIYTAKYPTHGKRPSGSAMTTLKSPANAKAHNEMMYLQKQASMDQTALARPTLINSGKGTGSSMEVGAIGT